MQTAFTCSLITCRELLCFFSPCKVRRTWFCNYSFGVTEENTPAVSCLYLLCVTTVPPDRLFLYINNAHQCISEPAHIQHFHFPLPLFCFNFLLTWLCWHILLFTVIIVLSVCCSLDWRLAYRLYGTASLHNVTISLCPWAPTNPKGHKPFVCVCFSTGLWDTGGSYLTLQGS